jgi:hypothetical protein
MYLFCRDIWFSAKINGAEYFSNWIGGIDHQRRRAYASNNSNFSRPLRCILSLMTTTGH